MDSIAIRLAGFLSVACLAGYAQPLTWTLLKSADPQPSARFDGAIAYDAPGHQVFVFGGQDSSGVRNDLWAYSFDKGTWAQVQPSGGPPPSRFGHTLVFDSSRRRVVVFGGQAGAFYNDV